MRRVTRRYSEYDAFARMYNLHWGQQSAKHLELLDTAVLGRLPPPARVLDLCCGTGQLAHALSERGYTVLGIDGSEEMLSYARTNAPGAQFQLADARDFEVQDPFDAVVSLYDSLNHLMSEAELAGAFRSAALALRPGGLFAFDLNMEAKYLGLWAGEFQVVGEEEVAIVRASVDPDAKRGHFDATIFYAEGEERWSRQDVHLEQTWYSEEEVRQLLAAAEFEAPSTHVRQPMPDDQGAANLLFVTARTQ